MVACDDLKLGGTLSSAGITGGLSINNTAISVADWSTLFGSPGMSASVAEVYGRPGGYIAGDRLALSRVFSLDATIHKWPANPANCTPSQQALMDNTDAFLAELAKPQGTFVEATFPDASTRFIHAYNIAPSPMIQPGSVRRFSVPMDAPWPYWMSGGTEKTDTLSGSDSLLVGGNAPLHNAVLSFAGDGSLSCPALGWTLTVAGSSAAVEVNLGTRKVVMSGSPAPNVLTRDRRDWAWFMPGANAVTATGTTITVTWRDNWL